MAGINDGNGVSFYRIGKVPLVGVGLIMYFISAYCVNVIDLLGYDIIQLLRSHISEYFLGWVEYGGSCWSGFLEGIALGLNGWIGFLWHDSKFGLRSKGGVAVLDDLPVDDLPEGCEMGGTTVLVVQIVGVLPDIEGEEGGETFCDGVGRSWLLGDDQRAV